MKKSSKTILLAIVTVVVNGCATPPPPTRDYPASSATAVSVASSPAASATPAVGGPPTAPQAPATAQGPAVDPNIAERSLASAVASYERGEFASAIRQLNPLTNDATLDSTQQLRALKALAFSQCSMNSRTACRQTFERALRVDALFELAPAERGHPLWQPEFDRAKKAVLGR